MKGAWNSSISKVCLKSHAPRNTGPSSSRDLCGEVNTFSHCWDINWEVVLLGQRGKLSEIFNGHRSRRVPCYWLQGHHLLKTTGETAGCCQACREAGNSVSSSVCHKIFTLKMFPLLKLMNLQKHPAVQTDRYYRQAYGACWRVKSLSNTAALMSVTDTSNAKYMWGSVKITSELRQSNLGSNILTYNKKCNFNQFPCEQLRIDYSYSLKTTTAYFSLMLYHSIRKLTCCLKLLQMIQSEV